MRPLRFKFLKSKSGAHNAQPSELCPRASQQMMLCQEVEGGVSALTPGEKRRARVVKDAQGKEVVSVCRDANFHKESLLRSLSGLR